MNYISIRTNVEYFELPIFCVNFNNFVFIAVMTVMALSIDEVRGSINMAREMAITGNYDSSLVYYEGAKMQLGRFLSTVNNQKQRESWRNVSNINFSNALYKYFIIYLMWFISCSDRLMMNMNN